MREYNHVHVMCVWHFIATSDSYLASQPSFQCVPIDPLRKDRIYQLESMVVVCDVKGGFNVLLYIYASVVLR